MNARMPASRQDLPEPVDEFRGGPPLKMREMAMGLQKGLLHQVPRIGLPLQAPTDLHTGQEAQITSILFQQRTHALFGIEPRLRDQFVGIILLDANHEGLPCLSPGPG